MFVWVSCDRAAMVEGWRVCVGVLAGEFRYSTSEARATSELEHSKARKIPHIPYTVGHLNGEPVFSRRLNLTHIYPQVCACLGDGILDTIEER